MKLQLRQPSPEKPDPKGIAQKKKDSSSGLLIQVFNKKPIRRPTQKQEKIFRSIENNQEKSKEPGTVCAVPPKKLAHTSRRNQKKKAMVPGSSSLLYYPKGKKEEAGGWYPTGVIITKRKEKKTNSGGNRLAAAAPPYPLKKSQICKGKQISKNHQNRKIIPLDLTWKRAK